MAGRVREPSDQGDEDRKGDRAGRPRSERERKAESGRPLSDPRDPCERVRETPGPAAGVPDGVAAWIASPSARELEGQDLSHDALRIPPERRPRPAPTLRAASRWPATRSSLAARAVVRAALADHDAPDAR